MRHLLTIAFLTIGFTFSNAQSLIFETKVIGNSLPLALEKSEAVGISKADKI